MSGECTCDHCGHEYHPSEGDHVCDPDEVYGAMEAELDALQNRVTVLEDELGKTKRSLGREKRERKNLADEIEELRKSVATINRVLEIQDDR